MIIMSQDQSQVQEIRMLSLMDLHLGTNVIEAKGWRRPLEETLYDDLIVLPQAGIVGIIGLTEQGNPPFSK